MPIPQTSDPQAAARAHVSEWFALIASGRWDEAMTLVDLADTYGRSWTRSEIEAAFRDCARSEVHISDPAHTGGTPRWNHGDFADGSGFWLDGAVPVGGVWSDLTVQFEFLRDETTGHLRVRLQDIHVL